ncbi:hypothetical protein D9757_008114 [Collybiopsis confluens]|uniref:Uncharacterized protein n=1 Tax=Collybiopsis confluens TaxID=2823264 RepID=A0A8H5M1T9_9AGAR|nr:hypothetical protein D9757_008114 [Collybiopsis confluens]
MIVIVFSSSPPENTLFGPRPRPGSDSKAPPGARAFRLTINLPPKHLRFRPHSCNRKRLSFHLYNIEGSQIVVAVYAEDKVFPGRWNPGSITHGWFTDAGWKTYPDEPFYGFELPLYDDSKWPYPVVRGRLPGRVSIPIEMAEPQEVPYLVRPTVSYLKRLSCTPFRITTVNIHLTNNNIQATRTLSVSRLNPSISPAVFVPEKSMRNSCISSRDPEVNHCTNATVHLLTGEGKA